MKQLSTVLALAVLLGFGSSVLANETAAPAADQKSTTAPTTSSDDDKSSAEKDKAKDAKDVKDDSSED